MPLETMVSNFGKGHSRLAGQLAGSTYRIMRELQGLRISTVNGAAANTNINVTGFRTEDTVAAVLRFNRSNTASEINFTDVTSEASIQGNSTIRLNTTNTSGDRLVVFWFNKSGTHVSGLEELRPHFTRGEARTAGQLEDTLYTMIRELQNLRITTVAGVVADADTDITDLADDDVVLDVLRLTRDSTASNIQVSSIGDTFNSPSGGSIVSDTNYDGSQLLVLWYDKSGEYRNEADADRPGVPPYWAKGQIGLSGQLDNKSLYYYLRELRGFRVSVVAGTTSDVAVTIPDFTSDDYIIGVVRLTRNATASQINWFAEDMTRIGATISTDADYSNDTLLVFWWDSSGV